MYSREDEEHLVLPISILRGSSEPNLPVVTGGRERLGTISSDNTFETAKSEKAEPSIYSDAT